MNLRPLQELVLSVKGLPRLARFLPKVVLALLVSVSAEGYKKLAIWLNDMGKCHKGDVPPPPIPGGRSPSPFWVLIALRGPGRPPHLPPWSPENYRLESAYEKHLIIKVVLVSGSQQEGRGSTWGTAVALGDQGNRVTPHMPASRSSNLSTHT